jgi:hypothetical protein
MGKGVPNASLGEQTISLYMISACDVSDSRDSRVASKSYRNQQMGGSQEMVSHLQ